MKCKKYPQHTVIAIYNWCARGIFGKFIECMPITVKMRCDYLKEHCKKIIADALQLRQYLHRIPAYDNLIMFVEIRDSCV